MQTFVRRNGLTAHISLQIPSISKSPETKTMVALFVFSAPAARLSLFFVTVECFAPPVKGYLRIVGCPRKGFFQKTFTFLHLPRMPPRFRPFGQRNTKTRPVFVTRLPVGIARIGPQSGFPQAFSGVSGNRGESGAGITPGFGIFRREDLSAA